MYTVINYNFYYKNNQPDFYSWSIGIFNGETAPIFHEMAEPVDSSWLFEKAAEKMIAENFEKYYETTLPDGTHAVCYRKIIEG